MINNSAYGGFVVSKNIREGYLIRYSFREESAIPALNGWTLYSVKDDDIYVNNSDNFEVLNAESMFELSPVMKELYDAPYGTDLCWMYEDGVLVGFYDLKKEKDVTIREIVTGEK